MVLKIFIASILMLAFALVALPVPAYAESGGEPAVKAESKAQAEAPTPAAKVPTDPGGMVTGIIKAIKEGKWAWLAALVLMLLTWAFNRVLKEIIPKSVIPWVAIALGVLTQIAVNISAGTDILPAIGNGITLGLAASGGWSAIGKHVLKKKEA